CGTGVRSTGENQQLAAAHGCPDFLNDGQNRGHVGVPALVQRSRNADVDDVQIASISKASHCSQPSCPHQFTDGCVVNAFQVALTGVDTAAPLFIGIDAYNFEAGGRERDSRWKADVSKANN